MSTEDAKREQHQATTTGVAKDERKGKAPEEEEKKPAAEATKREGSDDGAKTDTERYALFVSLRLCCLAWFAWALGPNRFFLYPHNPPSPLPPSQTGITISDQSKGKASSPCCCERLVPARD